jgi:hypothetical protein
MQALALEPDFFVPFLIFAIPIVAIVGGITAGIVKTVGQQRLAEMAARERIAAIERGIEPSKLPPPPSGYDDASHPYISREEHDRRRAQGLMVGGIITAGVGIGLMLFLYLMRPSLGDDGAVWAVGVLPLTIGLALLLSSWLVRPRNGGTRQGGA